MGRRGYPAEFRRRVVDLVAAGRKVRDVASDLGISEQTVYSGAPGLSWRTRSSSTSRSSTTASAGTRRLACLPLSSSKLGRGLRRQHEIQESDSTQPTAQHLPCARVWWSR